MNKKEIKNILNYIKFNNCICNLGTCDVCKSCEKVLNEVLKC